jgi:hypothetical protein
MRIEQDLVLEAKPVTEKEGFEPSFGAKRLSMRDSTHSAGSRLSWRRVEGPVLSGVPAGEPYPARLSETSSTRPVSLPAGGDHAV